MLLVLSQFQWDYVRYVCLNPCFNGFPKKLLPLVRGGVCVADGGVC